MQLIVLVLIMSLNSYAQNIRADSSMHTGNIYHLGGNVGIGTSNPFHDLSIRSILDDGDTSCIRLENTFGVTKGGYNIWDIDNDVDKLVFKYTDNPYSYANTKVLTIFPTGNVGIGSTSINSSAILHLKSNDKGLLIPRMTDINMNAIVSPANGLLVYSTSFNNFKYFDNTSGGWQTIPNLSEINSRLSNYVTSENFVTTLLDYSTTSNIASTYLSISEFNEAIADYVTLHNLYDTLNYYSLSSDISATYLTISDFNTQIANYVTTTDLTNTLNDYSTTTEINTLLSNYVTITDLTTTLNDYSTTTEINTLLSNYVTITDLTNTLNNYSTTADIVATYLSIDDFNTIIADYAQTSDLANYLTASEIQANYVPNHSDYTNSIFTTNDNGDLVYLQAGNQGQVLTVNNDGYFSWEELPSASESIWSRYGYSIFTKSAKNNVGIGFSDYNINDFYPQTKLHIFNLIENDAHQTATSTLRLEEYDENIGFFKAWDIQNNNGDLFFAYSNSKYFEKKNPSKKIVFSKNGYVGINTTAPQYFLDVKGDARIMQDLTFGTHGGGITHSSSANLVFDTDNNQFNISSTGSFAFLNNENEVASITTDGDFTANDANFSGTVDAQQYLINGVPLETSVWNKNGNNIYYNTGYVGIGTNSPTAPFHIKSDDPDIMLDLDASKGKNSQLKFAVDGKLKASVYYDNGTNDLAFKNDDITALRINTDGNIEVGNTADINFTDDNGIGRYNSSKPFADYSENLGVVLYGNPGGVLGGSYDVNGNHVQRSVMRWKWSNVYFGTPDYSVTVNVNGTVNSQKFYAIDQSFWPDYVFTNDYDLMPLDSLQDFIQTNQHLPNVPSEQEVLDNGVELANMQAIQMEKIEELTLYILELNEIIKKQQEEIEELKKTVNQ